MATVRANTDSLLARISQVGEGSGERGKKRRWQRLEEEKMRLDRAAVWRAKVSGRSNVQRRNFYLE